MTSLNIGTARARPGEKSWGQLRIRESKQSVLIPVAVLNGKKAGPHLVFIANQHGTEINGLAAIREFVQRVDPKTMRGTIVAFPTVNPLAAQIHEHSWLEKHEGGYGRMALLRGLSITAGCILVKDGGLSCVNDERRIWESAWLFWL